MTLQIGEVVCGDIVCYFCTASDSEERRFYIALVRGDLESMVVRVIDTHMGTAYSHIVIQIHKTSTRVLVYNIDILDEIFGIVQIPLMRAWSRRADRHIQADKLTTTLNTGRTPPANHTTRI
jgi:hypothetical protein